MWRDNLAMQADLNELYPESANEGADDPTRPAGSPLAKYIPQLVPIGYQHTTQLLEAVFSPSLAATLELAVASVRTGEAVNDEYGTPLHPVVDGFGRLCFLNADLIDKSDRMFGDLQTGSGPPS